MHDADRFCDHLHEAEDQLHWGTDPRALDQAAEALARFEPGHVLVEQLAQRAAVLRATRRELLHLKHEAPPHLRAGAGAAVLGPDVSTAPAISSDRPFRNATRP